MEPLSDDSFSTVAAVCFVDAVHPYLSFHLSVCVDLSNTSDLCAKSISNELNNMAVIFYVPFMFSTVISLGFYI